MAILTIIIGLFMAAIGFLAKAYPNLIAGYNTMPRDKKKNVDIEGLSTLIRNGLAITGLTIIGSYFVFKWLGFTTVANLMIVIVTLAGVTTIAVKAQRFDHNKSKSKLHILVLGAAIIFIASLLTYGFIPTRVIFDSNSVRFSGMYSFTVNSNEIASVELFNANLKIKLRTNGFSVGSVNKGTFIVDSIGKCRLLLNSGSKPYIVLTKTSGEVCIINLKSSSQTHDAYQNILKLVSQGER
ncbi:MAG: DUF3784 domain-containing protein [Bacteroidales bacterium]|nr:DUF3784 domain-containing protein [Bacteroidales bacterium]